METKHSATEFFDNVQSEMAGHDLKAETTIVEAQKAFIKDRRIIARLGKKEKTRW